jgi:hypothetical protein
MRRRWYLQTAGLGLTGGLAGCSDLGMGDDATSMPTATPTPTEEPTPREEPPNLDPPLWLKLLPRDYLDNEGEYSDAAVFQRVDWEWYLGMRNVSQEWGPAGDESWSFAPTEENAGIVPSADILKTPQWGAVITAFKAEVGVFNFPNLGPEMERQCGLAAEAGGREAARVVDEVIAYHSPNVTIFTGADTDAVRDALADNDRNEFDDAAVTAYTGAENAAARRSSCRRRGREGWLPWRRVTRCLRISYHCCSGWPVDTRVCRWSRRSGGVSGRTLRRRRW